MKIIPNNGPQNQTNYCYGLKIIYNARLNRGQLIFNNLRIVASSTIPGVLIRLLRLTERPKKRLLSKKTRRVALQESNIILKQIKISLIGRSRKLAMDHSHGNFDLGNLLLAYFSLLAFFLKMRQHPTKNISKGRNQLKIN